MRAAPRARLLRHAAMAMVAVACSRHEDEKVTPGAAPQVAVAPPPSSVPRLLYLPDAAAPAPKILPASVPANVPAKAGRCPPEMVDVRSRFCIDRYESSLVDADTGREISPYYHPTGEATRREYERWQRRRRDAPTPQGLAMPVPAPPEWQLAARRFEPMSRSIADTVPNGYMSGQGSALACERAKKRLCAPDEWITACRGERNTKYPYGEVYEEGRCNVFRPTHPARVLHGDPSRGHMDPRLNLVEEHGQPLLGKTGALAGCKSQWGSDAIYDMVGNLDEWIDDPDGTFLGGFYSRSTKEGCDARVEAHEFGYYDYSLGTRCCL